MIHGGQGKKPYEVIDYFVKWKGWTCKHNSWVCDLEMGNAQEAIEDYENRTNSTRRLDATKTVTPQENKRVTMILNFKYEDQSCFYLAQCQDGKQKWVKDLDPDIWHDIIQDYWYSVCSDSDNDEP